MSAFGKHSIHLVHDPDSLHPFPLYDDIDRWTEDTFSAHFDIFASFEAETRHGSRPAAHFRGDDGLMEKDYAMNLPRMRLYGKLKKAGEAIPKPMPQSKGMTWKVGWIHLPVATAAPPPKSRSVFWRKSTATLATGK